MDPVEECSDVRALHRSAARRRCLTAKAHLDIGSAEGCAGKPDMFAELVVDVVEMRLQVRIEKALVHATDACECQRPHQRRRAGFEATQDPLPHPRQHQQTLRYKSTTSLVGKESVIACPPR